MWWRELGEDCWIIIRAVLGGLGLRERRSGRNDELNLDGRFLFLFFYSYKIMNQSRHLAHLLALIGKKGGPSLYLMKADDWIVIIRHLGQLIHHHQSGTRTRCSFSFLFLRIELDSFVEPITSTREILRSPQLSISIVWRKQIFCFYYVMLPRFFFPFAHNSVLLLRLGLMPS